MNICLFSHALYLMLYTSFLYFFLAKVANCHHFTCMSCQKIVWKKLLIIHKFSTPMTTLTQAVKMM